MSIKNRAVEYCLLLTLNSALIWAKTSAFVFCSELLLLGICTSVLYSVNVYQISGATCHGLDKGDGRPQKVKALEDPHCGNVEMVDILIKTN